MLYQIFLIPKLEAVAPCFFIRDIQVDALLGLILVILTRRGQTLAAGALVGMGGFFTVVSISSVCDFINISL